jgi:putative oxidoreductase
VVDGAGRELVERAVVEAQPIIRELELLSPVLDLVVRLWLAAVFFKFGLSKLVSWDITIALFTYQYHVPLVPPAAAAMMAMTIELVFPVFLALGLGSRLASAVLFVFNFVAVVAYPDLHEPELKDHIYWGFLLLMPLVHGPGRISVDHVIRAKYIESGLARRGTVEVIAREGLNNWA